MLKLKIEGYEELDRRLAGLDDAVREAAERSVKRAALTTRTFWVREIVKVINLGYGEVKDLVRIHGTPYAGIKLVVDSENAASLGLGKRGRSMSALKFGARQTSTGVSAKIYRGKISKFPHAFIATMPSTGHRDVFVRKIDPTTGKRAGRLPIKRINIMALEHVAQAARIPAQAFAHAELKRIFGEELARSKQARGL